MPPPDSSTPQRLGVVGAGTMGAGIAQLGVLAGIETRLHDPFEDALERGIERLREGLRRGAERGRWSEDEARAAEERLHAAPSVDDLSETELVIEAAPERPELKRELFARLSEVCSSETVLATNTSSILVSSIATAAARPENVVGMHFFNPPPLMKLLEVIAAAQTGERALAVARATGEAMGKHVIVAVDGPGFLVNRCGRPFGSEALRLLQERVATVEQIDRICRLGGGFRMGPFELMDLVGIDVGFEVAQSFTAQSFGEPRWKPNMLQAQKVAAGQLGRKTGRGWYEYGDGAHRPDDADPPPLGGGDGRPVAIDGSGRLASALRERARDAGFDAREASEFHAEELWLLVDAESPAPVADEDLLGDSPTGPPLLALCADLSLAQRGQPEACGFHLLPPLGDSKLMELTRLPSTPALTQERAEEFATALGYHHEWVCDAPGLVLGRIVCQLANEAAFAIGEGVGTPEDVDAGVTLGLNHPRGPVEWSRAIGLDHVLATIDGLYEERREERYRAAPLLRRSVAASEDL
ncbi:MAG TPA: 3-hydroxyacyl-CoA dehydrogenase NAD-binding domain-containing protein [Thermoleophilaceae bacterium]